jgi:cytochrome P450
VEEILRYDTPLHLFTRYALEPLEIGGVRFATGDKVGLLLGAANRDPVRFPEPDRFDPDRQENPHVAFGAGLHFCIGAPLARLELAAALPRLVARLPGLRLADTPRYRDTYHFRGLERLDLAW